MNYTKEQLLTAKEILLNLISEDREIIDDYFGICLNLCLHKLNTEFLKPKWYLFWKSKVKNKNYMYSVNCIELVAELAKGWIYHSGLYAYPVPDNKYLNKWEGKNLELRIDLMKHIIGKINIMLEGM